MVIEPRLVVPPRAEPVSWMNGPSSAEALIGGSVDGREQGKGVVELVFGAVLKGKWLKRRRRFG
jgi:hypothetical protein